MAVLEDLSAAGACVNDTAKQIICDADADDVVCFAKPSTVMAFGQLRQRDNELHGLRSGYDAEVQACASLREQSEAYDGELGELLAPLQEELNGLRNAIEAIQTAECRSIMSVEEQLAMDDRQLRAREQEISVLKKRLDLLTQSSSQLLQGDKSDTAADTLHATDDELSKLQEDVMFREEKIASITTDLKRTLEYVINVNIAAAGGPSNCLGPTDFIPHDVQGHLNLGEHGQAHLIMLFRKYELQMRQSNDFVAISQRGARLETDTLNEMERRSSLRSQKIENEVSKDIVIRHHSDVIRPSPKMLSRDALGNSVNSFEIRRASLGPDHIRGLIPVQEIQGYADRASTGEVVEESVHLPAGSPVRSEKSTFAASDMEQEFQNRSSVEPYRPIFAIGARPEERPSLLDMTINWLNVTSRDATGFGTNEKGRSLARLSYAEINGGVYSEWVSNFTHAGLQNSLTSGQSFVDPAISQGSRQALVLTSERILLFQAATWNVMQVIALSEIFQLLVSSYSETILVIRTHGMPDVLLDISSRGRFLDEIILAATRVAAHWGGTADFAGALQVRLETEPLIPLLDECGKCAGSVAFLEQDVFLLLPFLKESVLLGPPATVFFGLLDIIRIHRPQANVPAVRKLQAYLFVLKNGLDSGRQLHWCRNPGDARSVGCIDVDKIREICPVDTDREDGFYMRLGYESAVGAETMTLRANSSSSREDWMASIQKMQTWL